MGLEKSSFFMDLFTREKKVTRLFLSNVELRTNIIFSKRKKLWQFLEKLNKTH